MAVKAFSPNVFDIRIAENVQSVPAPRRRRSDEAEEKTAYQYDLYTAVVTARDYGSFISGVIHVRYSLDDENALINKGIADRENAEYTAYRDFVAAVKTEAVKYFEKD